MKDNIIVIDRGSYLFLALKLGEDNKVYYCMPDYKPYPESHLAQIGCDFKEVERITGDKLWKYLDECDYVVFFDCYDEHLQKKLSNDGINVLGSGESAKMELDRIYFMEMLKELNMPIPKTEICEGVSDLIEYLKSSKGVKYIKGSMRGDFETKKFTSMLQIMPWINDLKARLGEMSEEIKILVQNEIKSSCEVGADIYNLNGEWSGNPLIGYEIKDKGYIGKVMDIVPDIIQNVLDKIAPKFKELGCKSAFSNELRITESGKVFFTDSTNREPSPPSHLKCELYENWAECIKSLAKGEMPEFIPKFKYGVEIILHSADGVKEEMFVKYPKEVAQYVKLTNHTKEEDGYYCIPNDNDGYIGAVIGMGNSIDESIDQAKEVYEQIEADGLDYSDSMWDEAKEQIKQGEKYGIRF